MPLTKLLTVAAASLLFSSAVLAVDVSNSSQHIVPNARGDASIDTGKVELYKGLLDNFRESDKYSDAFQWKDILDDWFPPNAVCSQRCLACAAGCNPICCIVGGTHVSTARPGDGGRDSTGDDSSQLQMSRPYAPGIGRPFPIPPLACPCHCEASCPRNIQAICCFTPGSNSRSPDGPGGGEPRVQQQLGVEAQKSIFDTILNNPHELIWGRPGRPALACPCFCQASCPPYIQAICCTTPGSGAAGDARQRPVPAQHDSLAMVTETATGDPVSVLAAVNLTAFDSFVTLNLVQGLGRSDEISHNPDTKTFEITLSVVAGPKDAHRTLAQSFQVIDGSRLLEQEQIFVGLGFMSRLGAVKVDKDFLTSLEDGLPVLTGVQLPPKDAQ